jgi:hypothetical protein
MQTEPDERRMFQTAIAVRDVQAVGAGPYRYLEGRAVPYDTWSDVNGWLLEQHRHGSFKRSTDRTPGSPLLLFHDNKKFPIGHGERWTHRDDGMHGVWQLNDRPEAQEAGRLAARGDLTGLSIGFMDAGPPEWSWPADFDPELGDDHKARVTRVNSRLVEVSMTPTPAFEDAAVTMVRTRARPVPPAPPTAEVDRWRRIVDEVRSG